MKNISDLNDHNQSKEDKSTLIYRIISILLTIVLIIAIIFMVVSIYTFIQVKLIRKPFDHFAGVIVLLEKTESMKPTIDTDDIVFAIINNKNIKENDIIVYYDNELTITHRLVSINENTYITIGDNANSDTELINKNQIVGKVIYIWKIGIWKRVFTAPAVYIPMLLTLMVASFTILEYKKETNQRRKDGEEKS